MVLNFYSRMRFITNLLPLLRTALTTTPHFSRTLSVLGAGHEGPINFADLELKTTFSGTRCADHTTTMNSFMVEELTKREENQGISFLHSSPGVVLTNLSQALPVWARVALRISTPLIRPFTTSQEETGARQLFIATSAVFPPQKPVAKMGRGVEVPRDLQVSVGSDGQNGSGAYLVNWNGDITGKMDLLREYRGKGVGKTVWEHMMGTFERVEGLNAANLQAEAGKGKGKEIE
jgi:hypothetical protein